MNNRLDSGSALCLRGLGVSPGIAVATAVLYRSRVMSTPTHTIGEDGAESEWIRLETAKAATRRQLLDLRERLGACSTSGEAGIIDGHLMVVDDELLGEEIRKEIFGLRHNAEWAVRNVANKYIAQFNEADDALFRERADDLADVSRRILRNLMGIKDDLPGQWDRPCVVVAENLSPSETLALPRDVVKAVVLDRGSLTSHAALVIRALGIPAVFGLDSITRAAVSGQQIAVDGSKGLVLLNPSDADLARLLGLAERRREILASLEPLRDEPAVTPDGFRVRLFANIENVDDLGLLDVNGAEGIGLFRTEYLWLASGRPVGEEEQVAAYHAAIRAMGERPVVIRVYDLGGDKFIGGVGLGNGEKNPFLGMRSLRYLLKNESVLRMQFRAILRAAETGNVYILLPMVTELVELKRARRILEDCVRDLAGAGMPRAMPRLGVMIEVPSAALIAPFMMKHADFVSIGSNDLTQYTMAADRTNPSVSHLYQPAHPAVLRLIKMSADAAHAASAHLCLCGEMASNPVLAVILLGMRFEALSMSASAIPVIKALVRGVPVADAEKLAQAALAAGSAGTVVELARGFLARYVPDLLTV